MSDILKGLNEKQREAVQTVSGPVLILAGAGSGKTKTLIHRIAYLIVEKHVHPWNILAVTFTNKAAKEMAGRMIHLLDRKSPFDETQYFLSLAASSLPTMGTFHSVCSRILRQEIRVMGIRPTFVIYDTVDSLSLIKEIMRDLSIDPKRFIPQAIAKMISKQKNELQTPDQFFEQNDRPFDRVVVTIAEAYQKQLRIRHALDFDDLIMVTVRMFQEHPSILKKYQDRFLYIMVDEYQDTNHAQFMLVHLLSRRSSNLCAIGDDYQAIYRFRGADYRNILEFEHHYPKTKIIALEQNYRSTQTIVEIGKQIISDNRFQKKKNLWTSNPKGDAIIVHETFDEREESEWILHYILTDALARKQGSSIEYISEANGGDSVLDRVLLSLNQKSGRRKKGKNFSQVRNLDFSKYVILYRTNAQSRALEEVFLEIKVPYQIVGGIHFYERKEVKDMIAHLRLISSPSDLLALSRIINVPPRGIGPKTLSLIRETMLSSKTDLLDICAKASHPPFPPAAVRSLRQFSQFIIDGQIFARTHPVAELIDYLLEKSGMEEALRSEGQEGEERMTNIKELKTVAKRVEKFHGTDGLTQFLEEIVLQSDIDHMKRVSAVTLMTVHSAKGLEFPVVIIAGLEEGLFPHANSLFDPNDLEEERRLCYVAVTRAKEKLVLTHASQRMIFGTTQINARSRFLDAIKPSLVFTGEPF